jgi:hypothetical protein
MMLPIHTCPAAAAACGPSASLFHRPQQVRACSSSAKQRCVSARQLASGFEYNTRWVSSAVN